MGGSELKTCFSFLSFFFFLQTCRKFKTSKSRPHKTRGNWVRKLCAGHGWRLFGSWLTRTRKGLTNFWGFNFVPVQNSVAIRLSWKERVFVKTLCWHMKFLYLNRWLKWIFKNFKQRKAFIKSVKSKRKKLLHLFNSLNGSLSYY